MIYRNSSDPILVKKIGLKIWRLRDEIEAVIEEKFKESNSISDEEMQEIFKEYQVNQNPKLQLVKEEEEETETEATEESSENTENSEEDTKEDAKETILQRRPNLIESKLINGKAVLAEVFMDKMYFFSNQPFIEGQSIVLDFLVPKRFIVNADVSYCRMYNLKSRIIGGNKLPYRVCVEFTFLRPGEKTLLRQFIESIEWQDPNMLKAAGTSSNEDEEEEIEEESEETEEIEAMEA